MSPKYPGSQWVNILFKIEYNSLHKGNKYVAKLYTKLMLSIANAIPIKGINSIL